MSNLGPYMYVSRDEQKQFPEVGRTFRVILYGAFNAMGLIGTESNGIAVLDDTSRFVVLDEHCKGPAGCYGHTEAQAAEYTRIMGLDWEDFRAFVNGNRRTRCVYDAEGRPVDPEREAAKTGLKSVKQVKGVPGWVSQYLNYSFSSGGRMGPDGEEWIKSCRAWLRKFLKDVGGNDLDFHKNHYTWSAFFKIGNQWFYMSCSDCRHKLSDWLLVRTAQGPKDYTGGRNERVRMDQNFYPDLCRVLGVDGA
jgi:hypothetical protein